MLVVRYVLIINYRYTVVLIRVLTKKEFRRSEYLGGWNWMNYQKSITTAVVSQLRRT